MQRIGKAFRRPPKLPYDNRNGSFPRLSVRVARGFRYTVSLRRALLTENLGKLSL